MELELHENFNFNPLSDHLKQIGEFNIGSTELIIVTHNVLNKCTHGEWPDNAWNIEENDDQYQARLNLLAAEYALDIKKGASVIALQEAPRKPIADKFFTQIKELSGKDNLGYVINDTADTDEQALMFIYNKQILGECLNSSLILDGHAQSLKFKLAHQDIEFINIHALYKPDQTKQKEYADQVMNLMKIDNNELKIRIGDHNANNTYYSDLIVGQSELSTSVAYNIKEKCFDFKDQRDGKYKNYDGFAVSENISSDSYKIYSEGAMLAVSSNFPKIHILNTPNKGNLRLINVEAASRINP
ncbi:MAG: hypothetical protein ACK4OM_07005 [Alphaproteobacteria bacterium]